jgi:sugar lactone lactonase YvrE
MKSIFLILFSTCFTHTFLAQTLNATESVEYDPINGRFLASNGSSIIEMDGDGNEVAFFGDAEADYGMEVMGNVLYAIVGSSIIGYDLTSGLEVNSIAIAGASFLNGLASDGVNRLWATDFSAKKIHEINYSDLGNPTSAVIVANTTTTPNGICYDGANNRLVFVNWGSNAKIKQVDLTDNTVSTIIDNAGVGNIDGIDHDNNGNFYTSSWTPNRITKWSNEFALNEIITVTGLSSPADICYAPENDTLAIPNSGNSTIKYVGFQGVNVEILKHSQAPLICYPNPSADQCIVAFELKTPSMVELRLVDANGQVVYIGLNENMPASKQKVVTNLQELAAGTYNWLLTTVEGTITLPIIKL